MTARRRRKMIRAMKSRCFLLTLAVAVLYALHQDIWFWRTARPLVFGFLPIGLFYHACFSVAAALLMAALVKYAWPGHLDDEDESQQRASAIDSGGALHRNDE